MYIYICVCVCVCVCVMSMHDQSNYKMIIRDSNMNYEPDIRDKHNVMNVVIFDNMFIVHSYDDSILYIDCLLDFA